MGTITKYATTLEQHSDTRFQTNGWKNLENGVGATGVATTSEYTKNFVPQQLYAHDFDVQLPDQYVIQSLSFEVKIRGSVPNTKVPRAYFDLNSIGGHRDIDYGSNIFSAQPNNNLSDSFNIIRYTMDWSEVVQYKATKSNIETDKFGVILQFDKSDFAGGVSVEWIRVVIDYYELEFNCEVVSPRISSYDYMAKANCVYQTGNTFNVTFKIHNVETRLRATPQQLYIDIPLGLRIVSYSTSNGSFDENTRIFTAEFTGGAVTCYVTINLVCVTTGLKKFGIKGSGKVPSLYKYIYVERDSLRDDEAVTISCSDVRRWDYSYFNFGVRAFSRDGWAEYDIRINGNNYERDTNARSFVRWEFDSNNSSDGVSLEYQTSNWVKFKVPAGEEVDIYFTGVFLPSTVGENFVWVEAQDTGNPYTYDYVSAPPYTYILEPKYDDGRDIVFTNAQLVTVIETGSYVYPVATSEYDNPLVMDRCTLQLSKFNDLNYIGCVPLEQTHYDPKSTYKDTLLDTHYKNKRYMGKKGAIDETITLNVRLHPYDVTTIQGLIDMDKPVPINTNYKSFEGDSLNHRGWAELYGIVSKKTNPHWYDCDLSVKYITHNLNTRFRINKGSRVSDYFLPELMTDICTYGDDLTSNFYIETMGGYYYNKRASNYHLRNSIALPNKTKFDIKGMNPLSIKSEVNFTWYSTRNIENQDNNQSRIVRLVDIETGNAVVEYEWYDVDFSASSEYSCRVICRVLKKGAYKTILNRNLILSSDVEYDGSDEYASDMFGTELIFKLVGDKLTIQDCGFSGKELYVEDIDIQNGQYFFDVEFVNNNIDADAPDITNYLDIQIKELQLTSLYSNYYKNLLVSPFPVPNKKIVFTRDSEEGTIFYLLDDGTECSYMINPYYQYHCGVDLQSREHISIFNLDNNYQVVYIVNGLIKLGINRFNGRLTLYKYDKYSQEYVLTNTLQLTKYDDININSFSDDKLELQVSDTIITVWRGHPYIHFAHPTEDIVLNGEYNRIYADGVGNSSADMPRIYSLVDNTNLLPENIASNSKIKKDAWSITESEYTPPSETVTITLNHNGGLSTPSVFYANFNNYTGMSFIVDGVRMDGTVVQSQYGTHKLEYKFAEAGEHTVRAIYYRSSDYFISDELTFTIEDNSYKITPTFPSRMYYLQNDFTCVLTYYGEPIADETVTFYVNGLSYTRTTDENGVARLNNRLSPLDEDDGEEQTDYHPNNNRPYTVTMQYSEGGEVLASAVKDATILKGYVNIALDKTVVHRGDYIVATFTNNLDPDDDDIDPSEVFVKDKQVVLTINGMDYPRIVDENGEARLYIRLFPKTYDLRVSFAGDIQYNGTIKNFELNVVD